MKRWPVEWLGLVWGVVLVVGLPASWWQKVALGVGLVLGVGLEWLDRLMHVYWMRPEEQLSIYVKHLLALRRYKQGFGTLRARKREQRYLVTNSVIMMVVWVPLAVYVLSSTGSYLAMGVMMGLGLNVLVGIGQDWQNKAGLKEQLFWPIRRSIADKELILVVGGYLVCCLWFSGQLLR